jgi:hypothetical protein
MIVPLENQVDRTNKNQSNEEILAQGPAVSVLFRQFVKRPNIDNIAMTQGRKRSINCKLL